MCRIIEIPLDDLEGHLVDPPIVDLLHFKSSLGAYVVTFIPSEAYNLEPTETVTIVQHDLDGKRITTQLAKLSKLLSAATQIVRLVYSGGGNFTFHFEDGNVSELADERYNSMTTFDAYQTTFALLVTSLYIINNSVFLDLRLK